MRFIANVNIWTWWPMLCGGEGVYNSVMIRIIQYAPEDPRYQDYLGNNYSYNNNSRGQGGGPATLYHQGLMNTRSDPGGSGGGAAAGWKLQRNQPQLTSIHDRVLPVGSPILCSPITTFTLCPGILFFPPDFPDCFPVKFFFYKIEHIRSFYSLFV